MTDVTQQFELCRETARHIWNSCFAHQKGEPNSGAAFESFDRICEELFDALILTPFSSAESSSQLNVQGFTSIRVVPAIPDGTPILINRTEPSSPYWDDPMKSIHPTGSQLGFIGFFDWDSYGMIDMRYLRVRILTCDANPLVVGREALIEMSHAKVMTSI
jgi:hypothetical protein